MKYFPVVLQITRQHINLCVQRNYLKRKRITCRSKFRKWDHRKYSSQIFNWLKKVFIILFNFKYRSLKVSCLILKNFCRYEKTLINRLTLFFERHDSVKDSYGLAISLFLLRWRILSFSALWTRKARYLLVVRFSYFDFGNTSEGSFFQILRAKLKVYFLWKQ